MSLHVSSADGDRFALYERLARVLTHHSISTLNLMRAELIQADHEASVLKANELDVEIWIRAIDAELDSRHPG